jgi:hypothetical protein
MANWRSGFVFLIVPLNLGNLPTVVGEQELILGIQGSGQVLSVENGLKLPKELQRLIDAHGSFKLIMNVSLELGFDC